MSSPSWWRRATRRSTPTATCSPRKPRGGDALLRAAPLELAFLLFLLAVFATGGALALGFPGQARWLPLGTSLPGALLVIACLVGLARRGGAAAGEEPATSDAAAAHPAPAEGHGFRHLMITLAIALPVAAVGGFLFAVPACYLTFTLLSQGRRKLRAAILLALASTLVTWFLFGRLLSVPLTRGIF